MSIKRNQNEKTLKTINSYPSIKYASKWGGYYLLTNRNTSQTNNQTSLNTYSENLQSNDVQVVTSLNNIELSSQSNAAGVFAIVRDAANGDRVYAWGYNLYGQLGVGNRETKNTPTLVVGLPDNASVKFVKSGLGFTLIVLSDNSIYAAGSNEFGSFGDGMKVGSSNIFVRAVEFTQTIESIDVGIWHTAAVVGGVLYTWGLNEYGQLGLGSKDNQTSPQVVISLDGKTLGIVKCGQQTTYIRTLKDTQITDKFYVWGYGGNAALGLGSADQENKLVPTELLYAFDGDVVNYWAGLTKLYISTYNSTTFTYNLYVNGQTGTGSLGEGTPGGFSKWEPFHIGSFPNLEIESIAFTVGSSTVLTKTGEVYSCGSENVSGFGVATPLMSKIELSTATQIGASSHSNTVFVISDNKLLGWGTNQNASFGIGNDTDAYKLPTPLDTFSSSVSSISQNSTSVSDLLATTVANEIYNDDNGFVESTLDLYVDKNNFPVGTVFSMNSSPVVNENDGIIECTIQASSSYNNPDGAKSIIPVEFSVTLQGFKLPTETNWGLVIGLSVGGGVLLLIIIGLIIWYMRRRSGGGSLNTFSGISDWFGNIKHKSMYRNKRSGSKSRSIY